MFMQVGKEAGKTSRRGRVQGEIDLQKLGPQAQGNEPNGGNQTNINYSH